MSQRSTPWKCLAFLLLIFTLGCSSGQTSQPVVDEEPQSLTKNSETQNVLESAETTPALEQLETPTSEPVEPTTPPEAATTATASALDLSNAVLPEATYLLNMEMDSPPQMVEDDQGNLHVTWYADGKILHTLREADGSWSDLQTIVDYPYMMPGISSEPHYFVLLKSADNQACVLWHEVIGGSVVKERCYADGKWTETAVVFNEIEPGSDFVAAYAPDGSLKVLQFEYTVEYFTIDQNGTYHKLGIGMENAGDVLFHTVSKDQGATWTTPTILSGEEFKMFGYPKIKIQADRLGNIHLVWEVNNLLYYRRWSSEQGWGEIESVFGDGKDGLPSGKEKMPLTNGFDLAVDPEGKAYIIVGFNSFDADGFLGKGKEWAGVGYMARDEAGKWLGPTPVASYEKKQVLTYEHPIMLAGEDGNLLFIWQAPNNDLNFTRVP